MVSPERALEHMSVEKAWTLLDTLSSQVVGKQTELQLMVGSRYHELIESADSIVSMKETSIEVLGLLRSFPQACSNVLQKVPSSVLPQAIDSSGSELLGTQFAKNISQVIQLMLHAPAAMWAALDSNRVLEAANLVLRCRSGWADLSSSFSAGMDSSVAAFLRSHVTYVEQFPHRIVLAGTRLLTHSTSAHETAGALAALLQLQAPKDSKPLRSLLELLLRRRGGSVVAMLTRAAKADDANTLEEVLQTTVTTVQRTIVDVHAIFAPRLDGSYLLEELAHPSCCSQASNETRQSAREGIDFVSHRLQHPHALMAHDILAEADIVVSLLSSEIRDIAADAWCLTERGDEKAADALKTSFYLLCVDMAAGLTNHLRVALQEIHACIKAAAQQERRCLPYGSGIGVLENAVGSFADAGLVIGRVAWMLNGQSGRPLQSALTPPACFAQRLRGRIEEQQLEAAFVIADTNGDGVVDAEEAAEALQAVSFGASAARVLDPSPYTSFTLSEFSLFATRLLEEQCPRQHLTSCLDSLLAESLNVWAEWTLEKTAALLTEGCNALSVLCSNPGLTDDLWRHAHGIWEDKTIELDRDDGDGIQETIHFPIMVSPAILCYIEGVAAELGRILSTADLASDETQVASELQSSTGCKSVMRGSTGGNATGKGAARYARSLAAERASADLTQALNPNGMSRSRNPAGHKSAPVGGDESGASAQARGLEADITTAEDT
eukprot:g7429.t1